MTEENKSFGINTDQETIERMKKMREDALAKITKSTKVKDSVEKGPNQNTVIVHTAGQSLAVRGRMDVTEYDELKLLTKSRMEGLSNAEMHIIKDYLKNGVYERPETLAKWDRLMGLEARELCYRVENVRKLLRTIDGFSVNPPERLDPLEIPLPCGHRVRLLGETMLAYERQAAQGKDVGSCNGCGKTFSLRQFLPQVYSKTHAQKKGIIQRIVGK